MTDVAALDEVLEAHRGVLGGDFTAYRNHAYRVLNFCVAQPAGAGAELEKTAVAAAFHDLGIWTDATFDYLEPSVRLATAHLARAGRSEWAPEITEMILQHHRISASGRGSLVEAFRRADWIDVSGGILTFGLPRTLIDAAFAAWPSAGFHKRLVQLELTRLRTHPWNPLPMVRL